MSWNIKTPGDYIDGPLTVAGSTTITGNLTVDTNVLAVNATTNTVGIGTTSTDAKFRILDASGNGVRIGFLPGTFNYNLYDATVHEFRSPAGTNSFGAITANGIGLGVTPSTSGIGVFFPTVQSASSDANCLDDYEEGTWTGTLKGSTTDPTIAVTATGRYTKIGRQVYVTINFNVVTTTGASGAVSITGLPFVNNSSNTAQGELLSNSAMTFTGSPFSFIEITSSTIQFLISNSNTFVTACTHNAGVGNYLQTTITYSV